MVIVVASGPDCQRANGVYLRGKRISYGGHHQLGLVRREHGAAVRVSRELEIDLNSNRYGPL